MARKHQLSKSITSRHSWGKKNLRCMRASRPDGFDSGCVHSGQARLQEHKNTAGGATTLFLFTAIYRAIVEINWIVFELSFGPL